jgi:D-alanyl-D-alanine carboxypeptidase
MLQTNFVDPTGLGKNLSNARDLFVMLTKIYSETPEIFNFTRLEKVAINGKILWTTNLLLPKYSSIIVGAKTGYKETAGENLVMILKFDNSPFIGVILLDSKDRFDDAEKIIKALKNYYAQ